MLHVETLIGRIDKSARANQRSVGERENAGVDGAGGDIHHLIQRNIVGAHSLRVHLHLEHFGALAPDWHVGHAGNAQQPGANFPIRDHRKIFEVMLLRGNSDLHDPAGRGHWLDHGRWFGPARQRRRRGLQTLLHQLPGVNFVSTGLEKKHDVRQIGH